jgi:simple sugar transport system ATP-binding protein
MTALVKMSGIVKSFGETIANDDVSLEIAAGEVHALLGENGAGKTTLMNILYGLTIPDEGTIEVGGVSVAPRNPADAIDAGVGMVHQHPLVVGALTVAENFSLGGLGDGSPASMLEAIADVVQTIPLEVDPRARIDSLPMSLRQRVEIVRCLAHGVRVLVLDEPTAVLTPDEVQQLFGEMERVVEQGRSVIFITHKLAEVQTIAQRVTVLRHGRNVGSFAVGDLTSAEMAEQMVGRELSDRSAKVAPRAAGAARLELRGVCAVGDDGECLLDNLDLEVCAGEIVAIAGVEGNGQRPLADICFGLRVPDSGEVLHDDERLPQLRDWGRSKVAIARIPEDRRHEGLLIDSPLWENLRYGPNLSAKRGLINRRHEVARARSLLEEFGVVPPDPMVAPSALSGGNQQKVVLARELSSDPDLVVAVNPTRGLDIGAQRDVRDRLAALRDAGKAVLVISTDLDEVIEIGDRVGVLYRGRLETPIARNVVDRARIGEAMAGLLDDQQDRAEA